MALVVKDRVRETSTTQGTGTFTLAGAVTGYQSFSAIGNGNTTYYTIYLQASNEWEVGIGTYTASGTTLSRDTILASSNGGSVVNFSAGTKDVFVTYPAGRSVYYDTATNVTVNQLSATTVDVSNLEVATIKAQDGTSAATIANSTGAVTVSTAFSANGGVTLGDAAGDALTINSSAVSIPNGLNFDSNTLIIDATANDVGIGTTIYAGFGSLQVKTDSTVIPTNQDWSFATPAGNAHYMAIPTSTSSTQADWLILRGTYYGSSLTHKTGIVLQDFYRDNNQYGGMYIQAAGGALDIGSIANGTYVTTNASLNARFSIDATGGIVTKPAATGNAVFNEDSVDADFRVESDSNTHALFVDAGNSRVGVNLSNPNVPLHVYFGTSNATALQLSGLSVYTAGVGPRLVFQNGTGTGEELAGIQGSFDVDVNGNYGRLSFFTRTTDALGIEEKMRIGYRGDITTFPITNGGAVFNENGVDADFRVESDANTHRLFVDAGADTVLMGTTTNTNSSKLVVDGSISETVSSTQYLVASQYDIGTAANEIPLNQYLGNLAYQDASSIAGQVGLSAGTAALPSLVSATDLDTGMWFPAANTLAWSTGGARVMTLDSSGNLGLKTTTPIYDFQIGTYGTDTDSTLALATTTSGTGSIRFGDGTSGPEANAGLVRYDHSIDAMLFWTAATERTRITSTGGFETRPAANGHAVFNEDGVDADFRVESDTDTHCLFVDASTDRVGIGTSSPRGLLDLNTTRGVKVYFGTAGTLGETQQSAGDYVANNLFVSAESAGTITYTKTTGDSGNAIIQDYSRGITFYTGVTGAATTTGTLNNFERMRLDSSGNLVVGDTSASYRLDVKGPTGNGIAYRDGTVTNYLGTTGSNLGYLGTLTNHPVAFLTNATERARITSGGYFKASNDGTYVSSTGTYHELYQTGDFDAVVVSATNANFTSTASSVYVTRNTTNNSFYAFGYYNIDAAAWRLRVADSGNVTNTNGSYGTISDAKMKTDIVDAGSQWADIKAIRFRKFKMKDDPDQIVQLGVVAQELEQTSPGLVDEHIDRDGDGNDLGTTTKSVKTSVLLMKAAVALQEAMARIEKLEAEVAALKGA